MQHDARGGEEGAWALVVSPVTIARGAEGTIRIAGPCDQKVLWIVPPHVETLADDGDTLRLRFSPAPGLVSARLRCHR